MAIIIVINAGRVFVADPESLNRFAPGGFWLAGSQALVSQKGPQIGLGGPQPGVCSVDPARSGNDRSILIEADIYNQPRAMITVRRIYTWRKLKSDKLAATEWFINEKSGKSFVVDKSKIKVELARSPDIADALAQFSAHPKLRHDQSGRDFDQRPSRAIISSRSSRADTPMAIIGRQIKARRVKSDGGGGSAQIGFRD